MDIEKTTPFLSIELDGVNKTPTVIVNGNKIEKVVHLGVDWSTGTYKQTLKTITISYYESPGILKTVTYENEITVS